MPYGMSDKAYAAEVARKKKAGIKLTQPKDTAALARAAAKPAPKPTSLSTPGPAREAAIIARSKELAKQYAMAPKTTITTGVPYGMTPATYAEEIKRKEAAGIPFTNLAAAEAFKQANPQLFAAAPPPEPEPKPELQPEPPPEYIPGQGGLGQLTQPLSQYSFPYEQAIRDLLAQAPRYTPPSEEELLQQAGQWAGLQIDPQVAALRRAQQEAALAAEEQRGGIEAAYSGAEQTTTRMLQEAGREAREQAIGRGVGRSGPTEWLTAKLQQPVMEQLTTAQAQKAAGLAGVAGRLGQARRFGTERQQELEERRGTLQSARLSELRNYADAQARGDWDRMERALHNLSLMAQQAQQFQQSAAMQMMPYYQETVPEEYERRRREAETFGEIPGTPAAPSVPTGGMSLRDYAGQRGAQIGYDPATKQVTIGGKGYSPQDLQAIGGKLDNGHWILPESAMAGLM